MQVVEELVEVAKLLESDALKNESNKGRRKAYEEREADTSKITTRRGSFAVQTN